MGWQRRTSPHSLTAFTQRRMNGMMIIFVSFILFSLHSDESLACRCMQSMEHRGIETNRMKKKNGVTETWEHHMLCLLEPCVCVWCVVPAAITADAAAAYTLVRVETGKIGKCVLELMRYSTGATIEEDSLACRYRFFWWMSWPLTIGYCRCNCALCIRTAALEFAESNRSLYVQGWAGVV